MRRSLLVCTLLALSGSSAEAQTIGLFFDPGAATCSGTIPVGTIGRMYIIAVPGGAVSRGITGVEFRVTGMPADWLVVIARNPAANIQLGDPLLHPVGTNVAFPSCQTSPVVIIFTVDILAMTSHSDVRLQVRPRNPPTNPTMQCPVIVTCEDPNTGGYPAACATGGEAIINPTGADCMVAVEPSSWTRVKSFYE